MFKNKLTLLLPVIVIVVLFIFSLTAIPSINPAPKQLPVAIVNEDEGVDIPNQGNVNMGDLIVQNAQAAASGTEAGEAPIKWIGVGSDEEVQAGLNDQQYYAALVIPADFSRNQASLRSPEPTQAHVAIYVNQGMSTMASTMASQVLNQLVDGINAKLQGELIAFFDEQGGTMSTKQAAAFAAPIVKDVTNVNVTGTHSAGGNAPFSLFQPLWMASIVGGIIFLFVKKSLKLTSPIAKLKVNLAQVLYGIVLALIAGYSFTWFADNWGLNIPQFNETALFLAISYMAFFLMISAVFSLIGIKGMAIFVIFLFFGAPLLNMPAEFLPSFYQDYVLTWLPMRFMIEGLRELFFFGQGLSMNHATTVLVWLAAISTLVLLASAFIPSRRRGTASEQ
ncbi:YhgE/Pip domain-containing protein [Paenibacillus harenae]|uniref:YhgE/Pip domain-containing protein n=1 Tax=Paenibacillus harenae TaxID=306543 RepID=UPI0027D7ACF8|nr:ABC transporter permease [Paenibacillus harenae]